MQSLHGDANRRVSVRLVGDRVTVVAGPDDRYDLWCPVFKGQLHGSAAGVELVGVLRPHRLGLVVSAIPILLLVVAMLPGTDHRPAIGCTAALLAALFWIVGPLLDRTANIERHDMISNHLRAAMSGGT